METFMKPVHQLSRCFILYRDKQLCSEGITGYQQSYLIKICDNPGIPQEQLSKILYVNKSSVTRQLAMLEKAGFITRSPHEEDKRQLLVFPTQKAIDLYPKLRQVIRQWNAALLENIPEEQQEVFSAFLHQLLDRAVTLVQEEGGCKKE